LNWIGRVNRRKVSPVLKIILREVDQEDDQVTDGGIVYAPTVKPEAVNAVESS
jgi:hypothetical protein